MKIQKSFKLIGVLQLVVQTSRDSLRLKVRIYLIPLKISVALVVPFAYIDKIY